MTVRKGDRFVVLHDLRVRVLTLWSGAFTQSVEATLPAGTILVAEHDLRPNASAFGCLPQRYDELEPQLVPEEDRLDPQYSGYGLSFALEEIGDSIARLDEA